MRAEVVKALAEELFLVIRLLGLEIFRRGKMCECAFELDVSAFGQRTSKSFDLRRKNPKSIHSRIDFQMEWQARRFPVCRFRGALEVSKVVQDRKSTRLNSSHPSISYAV